MPAGIRIAGRQNSRILSPDQRPAMLMSVMLRGSKSVKSNREQDSHENASGTSR